MAAACLILLGADVKQARGATLPPGFTDSVAFSGLSNPTAVRFASDGRVFVAEKSGLIKVFDGVGDTSATVFADLRTNVHNYWDRGLLGLALDPGFPGKPYVYVLYTYDHALGSSDPPPRWGSPGGTSDPCPSPPGPTTDGCVVSGRLSRLQAVGNVMSGPEQVLIEDWCQQYPSHTVGSLAFGADGALYASGGDGASFDFVDYGQRGNPVNPCGDPPTTPGTAPSPPTAEGGALRAQDLRTSGDPVGLSGTVIRINPDTGAGLPDNPLASSSDPNARRIVAHGLRNPFRLAVRPGTSEVWLGDVGWASWEEINRIPNPVGSVLNFGWPCYEGTPRQPGYDSANLMVCENLYGEPGAVTSPIFSYHHNAKVVSGESCPTGSSSITGLAFAFYANGPYPPEYDGALFFADYSRDCIWVMQKGTNNLPNPGAIKTFVAGASNPVDVQVSPSGELFYADLNGGAIRRIQFAGTVNHPPTARATASPTSGTVPLSVTFDASTSSDEDAGDSLSYGWDLDGNGSYTDSVEQQATHVFTASGSYTVGLRVTDSRGASTTDSVTVTAGERPTATITAPESSSTWKVGDRIAFSGTGDDPDQGNLPPSSFAWDVVLHHCPSNCHEHTIQTFDGIPSGSFTTPDHEYPSYVELRLTVTDSSGLSDSASVTLNPKTVELQFESTPSGLRLAVGSSESTTPFTRTVIEGSSNSLSATSPQTLAAKSYSFSSWSTGGAATHDVIADSPQTYTASFQATEALTLAPSADAQVREANANGNYSTANLRTDGGSSTRIESYLRFVVPDAVGSIESASLRLFAYSGTADGPAVSGAGSTWTETSLTWNNRPARAAVSYADKGAITTNTWVEFDVKPLVSGPGTYTFVLAGASSDGTDFYSREAPNANKPELVLRFSGGSGSDTTAPSVPQSVAAVAAGQAAIDVSWQPSTDAVGVGGYRIYRDGATTPTATVTGASTTTYRDTGLGAGSTHVYRVSAFDAAGNESALSSQAQATTASGGGGTPQTLTLEPVADAYVSAASAGSNYGTISSLRVDGSPLVRSYLRFDLGGLSAPVSSATLRVWANSTHNQGYSAFALADPAAPWQETTISHTNAPAPATSAAGTSGVATTGSWTQVDLTSLAASHTGGQLTLVLATNSGTALSLASRESTNKPHLIITTTG